MFGQSLLNGSPFINMDAALRSIAALYNRSAAEVGLTPIELCIMLALYRRDCQSASQLAHSVGRPATGFTPNLDKIENKGLLERRPDPNDRRALIIAVSRKGRDQESAITAKFEEADQRAREMLGNDYAVFLKILVRLTRTNFDTV